MFRAGLNRRLIALVAAYALALQTLFAVAASPLDPFASIICSIAHASPADPAPMLPPPGHRYGCAFCPLAGAGAVALPPSAATALPVEDASASMDPGHAAAPAAPAVARAGLARAPPVA